MTSRGLSIFLAFFSVIVTGCRDDEPVIADSAVVAEPAIESVAVAAVNPGWDTNAAGPMLLLSVADNGAAASVVLPLMTDSALSALSSFEIDSLSNAPVELFNRGGLAGSTVLILDPRQQVEEACLAWPRGRLADVPTRPWRTGFSRGTVVPLQLDSLESMTASDSSLIVREFARLSSAVAEGDDAAFRGLPFSVRKAYRFSLPGASVIIGDVIRRINEEANPREEHLLVIGERPSAGDAYSAAFHSRVAGAEDMVRTSEILGVVRFVRSNIVAVIVAFDYEQGGRAALIQRAENGKWSITWRSAFTGC